MGVEASFLKDHYKDLSFFSRVDKDRNGTTNIKVIITPSDLDKIDDLSDFADWLREAKDRFPEKFLDFYRTISPVLNDKCNSDPEWRSKLIDALNKPENHYAKASLIETRLFKLDDFGKSGKAGMPIVVVDNSQSADASPKEKRLGVSSRTQSAQIITGTVSDSKNPQMFYGTGRVDASVDKITATGEASLIVKPDAATDAVKVSIPVFDLGYVFTDQSDENQKKLEAQATLGVTSSMNPAADTFSRGSQEDFGPVNPVNKFFQNKYVGTAMANMKINGETLFSKLNLGGFSDGKISGIRGDLSHSTQRWIRVSDDVYIDAHLIGSGSAHKENIDPVTNALSNVYNMGANGKFVAMLFKGKMFIIEEAVLTKEIIENSSANVRDGSTRVNFGIKSKVEFDLGKIFGAAFLKDTFFNMSFHYYKQETNLNTQVPTIPKDAYSADAKIFTLGLKKKFEGNYIFNTNFYLNDESSRYVDTRAAGSAGTLRAPEVRNENKGVTISVSTSFGEKK